MRSVEEQSEQVCMSVFIFALVMAIGVGAFSGLVWLGNLVVEGLQHH